MLLNKIKSTKRKDTFLAACLLVKQATRFSRGIYVLVFSLLLLSHCSDMMSELDKDAGAELLPDALSGYFMINHNDVFTKSFSVTLNFDIFQAAEMRFKNSSDTDWPVNWEPYVASKQWRLEPLSVIAEVEAEFKDEAGTIMHYTDSIIYLEKITINLASQDNCTSYFGSSIDLSSDGKALVVGAPGSGEHSEGDTIGTAYLYMRSGYNWTEYSLTSQSAEAGDYFASAVAISGDGRVAVAGAPGTEIAGEDDQGSVHIFRFDENRNYWQWIISLSGEDTLAGRDDVFGTSVALSANGSVLAVGAPGHDGNKGSVYLYERNYPMADSWGLRTVLANPDAFAGSKFGNSVSLSSQGNVLLAGAYYYGSGTSRNKGKVYVFRRNGNSYTHTQDLTAPDGERYDYFGSRVVVSDDISTIAVAAKGDDVEQAGDNRGSVYLFSYNGSSWDFFQKITAGTGNNNDWFGNSLALDADGTVCLIGTAYREVGPATDQGIVFRFAYNSSSAQYEAVSTYASLDGMENDLFGSDVAISADGSVTAIGAEKHDLAGTADIGSVYMFRE